MTLTDRPLRFGFDLGTNSIGWAVYRLDHVPAKDGLPAKVIDLLGCGVRLFDDGRNPKDGVSLAEMRRTPRAARKRRDRFVMRRATLINQLVAADLLPSDKKARQALASLDPYGLRARGLEQALHTHEIGRALLHINQRRGFQSNRRADRKAKSDDKGKIAQGIASLRTALAASNARTFGAFLHKRRSDETGTDFPVRKRKAVRIRLDGQGAKALYAMYPSRAMIAAEFDALMAAQARHHPAILTDQVISDIRETIFHQRPLKSPLIGKCTFVPTEPRLAKALPSVEARRIYEVLNQLRLGDGVTMTGKLGPEQRDLLAKHLMSGQGMTFAKLRKTLQLGSEVKISLEEAGRESLDDYRARSADLVGRFVRGKLIEERFGPHWHTLPIAERDQIVQRLIDTDDEQAIVDWLMLDYKLSEPAARAVAAWNPPDGYGRLGRTATDRILAELESPDLLTYAEAAKRAGWHHSDERDGEIMLPLPYYGQILERHIIGGSGDPGHKAEKRYGRFPNPTAHVALNQLRRVANALARAYGAPAQIVIELARELKQSQEQKEKEQKRNLENRKVRERHKLDLVKYGQSESPESFLRLRLFEEQLRAGGGVAQCPFSRLPIGIDRLFSDEIEIEHLLPYSKTLDDSAANKVVCFREWNRRKRAKTPYQAFGQSADWPDIEAAAQGFPPNKRWRFAEDAMARFESTERDFLARQLNETRHLSRMARIFLQRACDPDQVYVTTGQMTAMLRAHWGLNAIWRDHNIRPDEPDASKERRGKARNDHRHHAVDACVIGAIDRSTLQAVSRAAGRLEELDQRSNLVAHVALDGPFPHFREAVRDAMHKVVVSVKPEHSIGGALHEDTAYGFVRDQAEAKEIGNLVYRRPLADLKPNEIDSVRDVHLRQELQALAAPFRDKSGKLADEKGLQAALSRFGTEAQPHTGRDQGVRRVRIGKEKQGAVVIKDRRTGAAYKALLPGENHHIDIVQMRDGTWRGFAATLFDVNQKGWRPTWEAQKLGGKLVMRLHKGDAVEIDSKTRTGVREIMIVHRLEVSANRVRLVPHNEGGDIDKRHKDKDDPLNWDWPVFNGMKARGARKVLIDPIGRVKSARSNVDK